MLQQLQVPHPPSLHDDRLVEQPAPGQMALFPRVFFFAQMLSIVFHDSGASCGGCTTKITLLHVQIFAGLA